MYSSQLLDRVAAGHLENRRHREQQRQDRIFNVKVRTIGIDKEALDSQVNERRKKEEDEEESLKAYAAQQVAWDRAACHLDRRQARDARHVEEAVLGFRRAFQQPPGRREFDLNDPELREGVAMLPGLLGEDGDRQARLRRQQEQLRGWSLQQQEELDTARQQLRLREQQYDQDRVDLDNRALQLQNVEEQRRKAVALATRDFNLAKAAEESERRGRERQRQRQEDRAEVQAQLQGELLTESLEQGVSALGLPRLRPDGYKGLTPEQRQHVVHTQQQQAEEKARIQAQQQQEELQQECFRVASARSGVLLERRQARLHAQLRRELDDANAQLAAAQRAQKTYLEKKVYTNIPEESYFSQFNTSSR